MATFNFDSITSASEFNTIFRFVHAYNKYKREHPGVSEANINTAIVVPGSGFTYSTIDAVKAVGNGVVPKLEDEKQLVDDYKEEINGTGKRRDTLEKALQDATKDYEDPAKGVDGKSLEDIEFENQDAIDELNSCRWGKFFTILGWCALGAIAGIAAITLLPVLAGATAASVPFGLGATLMAAGVVGGGVMAHKRNEKKYADRIKDAKEARRFYRKHQRKIQSAKQAMRNAQTELNNFNANFDKRAVNSATSMYEASVQSDIDEMRNNIIAIENRIQAELSACTPALGTRGYAEAMARKADAQAKLNAITAAHTAYSTLESGGSKDISLYSAEFGNVIAAENDYNTFDVPNIIANAESAQNTVIANVNNLAHEFEDAKETVKQITESTDSEFSTIRSALSGNIASMTSMVSNAKTSVIAMAVNKKTSELENACEQPLKEGLIKFRQMAVIAWQQYSIEPTKGVDKRIADAEIAGKLTPAEKADYDVHSAELNRTVTLMNATIGDDDLKKNYLIMAEINAGIVRAYSGLEKELSLTPPDATRINNYRSVISSLSVIYSSLTSGSASYDSVSASMAGPMGILSTTEKESATAVATVAGASLRVAPARRVRRPRAEATAGAEEPVVDEDAEEDDEEAEAPLPEATAGADEDAEEDDEIPDYPLIDEKREKAISEAYNAVDSKLAEVSSLTGASIAEKEKGINELDELNKKLLEQINLAIDSQNYEKNKPMVRRLLDNEVQFRDRVSREIAVLREALNREKQAEEEARKQARLAEQARLASALSQAWAVEQAKRDKEEDERNATRRKNVEKFKELLGDEETPAISAEVDEASRFSWVDLDENDADVPRSIPRTSVRDKRASSKVFKYDDEEEKPIDDDLIIAIWEKAIYIQNTAESMRAIVGNERAQTIIITMTNVIVVLNDIFELTDEEKKSAIKDCQDKMMECGKMILSAEEEYEKAFEALEEKIKALRTDLVKNKRALLTYGVEADSELKKLEEIEKAINALDEKPSFDELMRRKNDIDAFEKGLKKTINSKRPKKLNAGARKPGINATAAKCTIEGSMLEFRMRDKLQGRISHESGVGNALLDTMVILAGEIFIRDTEAYTLTGTIEKNDVHYEIPDVAISHNTEKHKDSDIVDTRYLGEAIVNTTNYISADRKRRDEFIERKGGEALNIDNGQKQIGIRNKIVKVFNEDVLAGSNKSIELVFEGGRPVVKVIGEKLTYGEIRALDAIIQREMFGEGVSPDKRKSTESFPPEQ